MVFHKIATETETVVKSIYTLQGKGHMRTFWLTGIKNQTAATSTFASREEEIISMKNLSPLTKMADDESLKQTPKFVDTKLFDLIEALPKNNQQNE